MTGFEEVAREIELIQGMESLVGHLRENHPELADVFYKPLIAHGLLSIDFSSLTRFKYGKRVAFPDYAGPNFVIWPALVTLESFLAGLFHFNGSMPEFGEAPKSQYVRYIRMAEEQIYIATDMSEAKLGGPHKPKPNYKNPTSWDRV